MNRLIPAVKALVQQFKADEARLTITASTYTETEARVEYIDRLFSMLGWDMHNAGGLPNSMKDVVREESQATETSAKRPDYTFRIRTDRKFFVEAKKPSVDIRTHKDSAFQIRSYGWTAGMPVSILTNFRTIRVYDTTVAPQGADNADVGLLYEIQYADLPKQIDKLVSIFGREAVATGSLEKTYGSPESGTIQINTVFLDQINAWRLKLAKDLKTRHAGLSANELNDLVQQLINRLIFIRMCEDRGIEGKERLRKVAQKKNLLELRSLFRAMDQRYNTGLFDVTGDRLQSTYALSAQVFLDVVEDLYFPKAPYSFSVLNADFLGQIYELFLTKRLALKNGALALEDKPAYEGREIITTPQPIVDEIVRRTFAGKLKNLQGTNAYTFDSIRELRVLDLAVGSGRFLLRSLDQLIDAAIAALRLNDNPQDLYRVAEGDYRLPFTSKVALVKSCLFGIDIDYNAVEVARFSLMVKLLEDERRDTLPSGNKILPNLDDNIVCGNSVVDSNFTDPDEDIMEATHPLDWCANNLPKESSLLVGNPPYLKTEEMKGKAPAEFAYYKVQYQSPFKQFDKYFVFIERAVSRMENGGWCGMVVPNKWITIEAGAKLRSLLASQNLVAEIVDFGNELLFEGKSTYVCLLVLRKQTAETFFYRHVNTESSWLIDPESRGLELPLKMLRDYGSRPWVLPANRQEGSVLRKLVSKSILLSGVVDVANGIQTSAEDIFPIKEFTERNGILHFTRNGQAWQVEKAITRPYLMDSARVSSYLPIKADARIIFPYDISNGGATLIPPTSLRRDYPLAWHFLNAHKNRLQERDVSPPQPPSMFYSYGRHQALISAFKSPKIVYSVNQRGDKYGFDQSGVGFASGGTAGEVSIINPRMGYSLEFILGLLNQHTAEFFLRKRGSAFRGGYYSRGSAVISDLPIPKLDFTNRSHSTIHNQIVTLVQELILIQGRLQAAVGRRKNTLQSQNASKRKRLKEMFDRLWGLNAGDQNISLPGDQD